MRATIIPASDAGRQDEHAFLYDGVNGIDNRRVVEQQIDELRDLNFIDHDRGLFQRCDDQVLLLGPVHASALGKTANCQTLVSLTLARGEVPVAGRSVSRATSRFTLPMCG